MQKEVSLSIIIPVYYAEEYIQETIKSILNQNLNSFELILVDDGSKDKSLELMNYFVSDDRVIVLSQMNKGATFARKMGLEYANGKYVLFFDSDDVLNNYFLKDAIKILEQNHADLLISDYDIVDQNLKYMEEVIHNSELVDDFFYKLDCIPFPGNKIFKKDILDRYKIIFDPVRIGQDLNFYAKYLKCSKKAVFMNKKKTKYRVVKSGISNSIDSRITDIIKSLYFIEGFYKENNASENEYQAFYMIKLKHLVFQISKLRLIKDKKQQRLLFKPLSNEIKKTIKEIHVSNFYTFKYVISLYFSYVKTSIIYKGDQL